MLLLLLLLPATPSSRCSVRNATQATQCPHIHVSGFPRWYEQLSGVYSRSLRGCGGNPAWIQSTPSSGPRTAIHTLATLYFGGFGGPAFSMTVFAPAPLRCDADPFGAVAVATGSHVTPFALNNTMFNLRRVSAATNTKNARVVAECRCHATLKLY